MIRLRKASGLKGIGNISVRKGSGLKGIANIRLRQSGGLKTVFTSGGGAFDVTTVPLGVYGGGFSAGNINITSGSCTVTPSGGMAPYTYAWSVSSDDGNVWVIESPSSATTRFRSNNVPPSDTHVAFFVCLVTDARGLTASSAIVQANVTNYGNF